MMTIHVGECGHDRVPPLDDSLTSSTVYNNRVRRGETPMMMCWEAGCLGYRKIVQVIQVKS